MAPAPQNRTFGPGEPLAGDRAAGDVTSRERMGWRYRLTALAILSERILPALLPAAGLVGFFLLLGWTGAFEVLEPGWRMALTLALLVGFVWLLRPLPGVRLPDSSAIERRLDRTSAGFPRPLATLSDQLAGKQDSFSAALWSVHRQRAERASAALRTETADVKLREKDHYALRAAMLMALLAAAFVAGDQRVSRIAQAFDWSTPRIAPPPPRLDAWIDPPAYTGRPPIFLSGNTGTQPDEIIRAPVGATLSVRSTMPRLEGKEPAAAKIDLSHGAGLEIPKEAGDAAPGDRSRIGVTLTKRVIRADSIVKVLRDGRDVAQYRLAVIPDLPPKVTLSEIRSEPASAERQTPGGVRVNFTLEDDYGIAKADLIIERVAGGPKARTLFPVPSASVPLRLGAGEVAIPTEDHPWAGEEVRIRLRIEDDLGQAAESETKSVTLPQRPFTQGVARALVEQRRALNFSPDDLAGVRLAFDGLLYEPERFTPKVGDFIALDMIRAGLRTARTDDRLREITEQIYELALYLENGDMTDAEKRLREAEARLREALEREASPEEIKKLTEDLRRAMDQFLREFAERALRDQDRNAQDRSPINPDRMLTQRDLADMLRKIEEMARSGNMAEAQRLLNELKQVLENLRSARRQDVDPRMRELGQQLEELDRLQREQRDLRDRTFQEGQQRRGQQGQQRQQQGQQGQRGQQRGQQQQRGQNGEQSLQEQQQALRDRLKQLRERLQQRGMQESEGFGEAEQGMGDAESQLGQGSPGEATEGQQRALDGLGKAGEGMAQELQRQMGQGEGEGEGMGEPGGMQRGRAENRTDPLGRRPGSGQGDGNNPDKLNEGHETDGRGGTKGTIGERADGVLRELRRRLGEFERPRDELEYLERLLRQR
ncbi:MAG: hypothetical protein FD175_2854 [Beijerinckiaceae bacterium]|nr:MAG: hypothetical protein FD175_2854 [Beijerinckiaceae bacterium]